MATYMSRDRERDEFTSMGDGVEFTILPIYYWLSLGNMSPMIAYWFTSYVKIVIYVMKEMKIAI